MKYALKCFDLMVVDYNFGRPSLGIALIYYLFIDPERMKG